eukprot:TRINITY_DN3083_c0_g1_i1.p1 TRINITY_DN3083_c0_g1~~TRINITY_DN3083_c0_g1_i1.p1  ORF type:complete len:888 (-),score=168.76 TRINITY_DN3083_c0_g1_i1:126-2789(-)
MDEIMYEIETEQIFTNESEADVPEVIIQPEIQPFWRVQNNNNNNNTQKREYTKPSFEITLMSTLFAMGLVSERALSILFFVFSRQMFDFSNLVDSSMFDIKKAIDWHTPAAQLHNVRLPCGDSFVFRNPIELLSYIVKSRSDFHSWKREWELNFGKIEHIFHSDSVFESMVYFEKKIRLGFKVLLIKFFVDGFNLTRSTAANFNSIYISIANQLSTFTNKPDFIYLVSLVPKSAKIQEVLDILAKIFVDLQTDGFECNDVYGRNHKFIAAIQSCPADSVSVSEQTRVVGAGGHRSCRKCLRNLSNEPFSFAPVTAEELRTKEHHIVSWNNVLHEREQGHGHQGRANTLLTEGGISNGLPAFFDLPDFGRSFYDRYPLDILHLMTLGILMTISGYIFEDLFRVLPGNIDIIRSRVQWFNFSQLAHPKIYPNNVVKVTRNGKLSILKGLNGTNLDSWYTISPIILWRLLSLNLMRAWTSLLRIYHKLKGPIFFRSQLEALQNQIIIAAQGIVKELGDRHSFTFPNWHLFVHHWMDTICFSGPPQEYSTQPFEHKNKRVKQRDNSTNHHNPARDHLLVDYRSVHMSQFLPQIDQPVHFNYQPIHKLRCEPLSNGVLGFLKMLGHLAADVIEYTAQFYNGFYLDGEIIRVEDNVTFSKSHFTVQAASSDSTRWGKIVSLFEVVKQNGKRLFFVQFHRYIGFSYIPPYCWTNIKSLSQEVVVEFVDNIEGKKPIFVHPSEDGLTTNLRSENHYPAQFLALHSESEYHDDDRIVVDEVPFKVAGPYIPFEWMNGHGVYLVDAILSFSAIQRVVTELESYKKVKVVYWVVNWEGKRTMFTCAICVECGNPDAPFTCNQCNIVRLCSSHKTVHKNGRICNHLALPGLTVGTPKQN